MLTADELASMHAALNLSLPESGTIQRKASVSDGMGGQTDTWSAAGTADLRVAAYGTTPAERVLADRIGAVDAWTVTFPADTDISAKDRVASGGRTFEVVGVLAPRSYEISRRVVVTEVI